MTENLTIVVAGATGVIGRRVVAALLAEGHRVTGLTRSAAKAPTLVALGAESAVADAYDLDALVGVLDHVRPDVVVHQLTDLANADTAANGRLRRDGTANLVAASRSAGVRRMVAQSIAWAYEPTPEPAHETAPLDLAAGEPRRTTVEAVAALEAAAGKMPEAVILRYGMLYGPGTWFEAGGLRAEAAARGEIVADESVTSFCTSTTPPRQRCGPSAGCPGPTTSSTTSRPRAGSGCPTSAMRWECRHPSTATRASPGRAAPRTTQRGRRGGSRNTPPGATAGDGAPPPTAPLGAEMMRRCRRVLGSGPRLRS